MNADCMHIKEHISNTFMYEDNLIKLFKCNSDSGGLSSGVFIFIFYFFTLNEHCQNNKIILPDVHGFYATCQ